MKFSLAAAAVAVASVAHAQEGFCPEAARFGFLTVNPTTVKVGDPISVTYNLTCAPQKSIRPQFIDYFLEVPVDENNGHQPIIYLARHTFDPSVDTTLDVLNTTIPISPTITAFPDSTGYEIVSNIYYLGASEPNGNPILFMGGIESTSITITSS